MSRLKRCLPLLFFVFLHLPAFGKSLQVASGVDIAATVYPGESDSVLLWIPPEWGLQGREPETELDDAMDAAINGIAALYIWEVHKGALPAEIGRVRSWSVRDWMKEKNFRAEAFPGMHLRDEVVERLRLYGLELTPRPLTHTAWEYYSMQYDRHADEHGPLGRRKMKPEKPEGKRGLFGFGRKKEDDAETIDETDTVQSMDAPYGDAEPQPVAYTEESGTFTQESTEAETPGAAEERDEAAAFSSADADDQLKEESGPHDATEDPQRTN